MYCSLVDELLTSESTYTTYRQETDLGVSVEQWIDRVPDASQTLTSKTFPGYSVTMDKHFRDIVRPAGEVSSSE